MAGTLHRTPALRADERLSIVCRLRRRTGLGLRLLAIICAVSAGGGRLALAVGDDWLHIGLGDLCVTEGEIKKTTSNRLSVDVPKMRAYVTESTGQSAEIRFAYLGPTREQSRLGSGEMRVQFG